MSSWLADSISAAEKVEDWLSPKRTQSLALLKEAQWPSRKTEAWKYTPVNAIERANFSNTVTQTQAVSSIPDLEAIELVFIDGKLDSQIEPKDLPSGLSITSLQEPQEWVLDSFSTIKPERHLFGLINDTLATQGCVIDVAANSKIQQPIRITHSFSEGSQAHTRAIVRIGEHASVSIIEQLEGDASCLNTFFAEYQVADNAYLEHYRLAMQTGQAISVGGCHFYLGEASKLNSHLIGYGCLLSRIDLDVIHSAENSDAKLNVVYLLDGKEVFDLHSAIEHTKPNGTSEQNVRCIAADRANAIFNGRIHIHRDAQKILAQMNNRNLLMSPNAQINTKPELEIYADDVRCAHGATIAEIDEQAMFYLQSRGISRSEAQIMLSFAFINELVDQMNNSALANWLRPKLRARFANMEIR